MTGTSMGGVPARDGGAELTTTSPPEVSQPMPDTAVREFTLAGMSGRHFAISAMLTVVPFCTPLKAW